jgi:hypothetical protein
MIRITIKESNPCRSVRRRLWVYGFSGILEPVTEFQQWEKQIVTHNRAINLIISGKGRSETHETRRVDNGKSKLRKGMGQPPIRQIVGDRGRNGL